MARDRRDRPDFREGNVEAQQAYLIGQAVRARRLALGLWTTPATRTVCVFDARIPLFRSGHASDRDDLARGDPMIIWPPSSRRPCWYSAGYSATATSPLSSTAP
jgi:hypothetical protein